MNPRMERISRVAPNPFARLARLRGETPPPPEDGVRAAAQRVFKSPDGLKLLDWMIAQSYGKRLANDAPESALRENEVRKNFLDQILALAEEQLEPPPSAPSTPRRNSRSRKA